MAIYMVLTSTQNQVLRVAVFMFGIICKTVQCLLCCVFSAGRGAECSLNSHNRAPSVCDWVIGARLS